MTLLVQMAHLAAGQYLLRLHLANCQIEDEGTRVLTQAFAKGFAPCLQILWLSENCITDAGAGMLSDALLSSLKCLNELSLFGCCRSLCDLLRAVLPPHNALGVCVRRACRTIARVQR